MLFSLPLLLNAQSSLLEEKSKKIQSIIESADSCCDNQNYQQAIIYCNEGLRLIKNSKKNHEDYISLNYILAKSYIGNDRIPDGISLFEKLLEDDVSSEKKCQIYSLLGKIYRFIIEDYGKAVFYLQKAAELYLTQYGTDKYYWEGYQLPLAGALVLDLQGDKASELIAQVVEYAKSSYSYEDYISFLLDNVSSFTIVEARNSIWVDKTGLLVFDELANYYEKNRDWGTCVAFLALEAKIAEALGDFYKSKTLFIKAIQHYTIDSGLPLSLLYSDASRSSSRLSLFDEAESFLIKAEEVAKTERDSINILKNIRYQKALLCIDKKQNLNYAIDVIKERMTEGGLRIEDYAYCEYNLGAIYFELDLIESKRCFEKALSLFEKGEGHGIAYAKTLNQLGCIASEERDYKTSISYFDLAIDIFRRLSSENNYSYIYTLRNAALCSSDSGQIGRAIAFAEEAKDIQWKTGSIIFPEVWRVLSSCYESVFDYRNKGIIEEQLDVIYKEDKTRQVVSVLNRVANGIASGEVESSIKMYYEADSMYQTMSDGIYKRQVQECLEKYGKQLGIIDSDPFGYYTSTLAGIDTLDFGTTIAVNNLAKDAFERNDYISSYFWYKIIPLYIKDDPTSLDKAYYASAVAGDTDYCKWLAERIVNYIKKQQSAVVGLTEEEQEEVWRRILSLKNLLLSTRKTLNNDGLLYDITLASRNYLLRSELILAEAIATSGNIVLEEKSKELKNVKFRLRNFKETLSPETIDSLRLREIVLNRDIVSTIRDFSDSEILKCAEYKDVANSLSGDEIAIEIVSYPVGATDKQYAAIMLKDGETTPVFVELCLESQIQKYSNKKAEIVFNPNSDSGRQLYKLFWGPILPYLNNIRHIYISTSGCFSIQPIEAYVSPFGQFMEDDYDIVRVSSTSMICQRESNKRLVSASVFGGLIYSSDGTEEPDSRGYSKYDVINRNYLKERTTYKEPTYLPWTKAEADLISEVLSKNGIQTTMITGKYGTESYFKSLSGTEISLIHIATHGFYLPKGRTNSIGFFNSSNNEVIIPSMQRSGLLLAGCADAYMGKPISKSEDGVLTASEISDMDLSNTELVVLSACETGLGDITEDGVEGLQRAFKKAGAQSIIMSLWKVNDMATSILMKEFYLQLSKGMDKKKAFRLAKNKLRNNEQFDNPYYWASFILLD